MRGAESMTLITAGGETGMCTGTGAETFPGALAWALALSHRCQPACTESKPQASLLLHSDELS